MSGAKHEIPEKLGHPSTVAAIRKALVDWYRSNKRDLPWRRVTDPYKIWVSEVMLQQTRVETVIPYYERFIERFPDARTLAEAPEEEVFKAWEGLGYYSRIRNFHSAVKEVVSSCGGKVPDDPETFSRLKGVGPYTVGAVLSIAYGKRIPAVDGNVMRVYSRLFALTDDIASQRTRKKMEAIGWKLVPEECPGDFNQALMELGATCCTPASPQCLFCPVRSFCDAYAQGLERELPVKKKQKQPLKEEVIMGIVECEGRILMEKRPRGGLLGGMYGLPVMKIQPGDTVSETMGKFCDAFRASVTNTSIEGRFEHVFSHRHWMVTVVRARTQRMFIPDQGEWEWLSADERKKKPSSKVFLKALGCIGDQIP
ncbi:A/G-specific adenine glycosylase [Staphylospora marina]|uniref:A/G-specific adenine glycosylase n=1 Tax=Staphylospora marina TaxID=2490858 RepID=UPI000F5C0A1A|nr:A/G-specific adenine glycosylase [Staphylospora marina]